MSLVLPVLYHWSRAENRSAVTRRGLKPTCPIADRFSDESFPAVCLGTSPSHAWSLSGGVFAQPGETWDLWQVTLDEDDEVHPLPFYGNRLNELRVAGPIPKSRLWLVGQRTVGSKRPW